MTRPDGLPHLVEVRIDPERHSAQPENEIERLQWEVLDTVYALLGEYAVRITLQALRDAAAEQGIPFPATDKEMFDDPDNVADPDAPKSYRDLAPDNEIAALGLAGAFDVLIDQAYEEARAGIVEGAQFREEIERLTGEGGE